MNWELEEELFLIELYNFTKQHSNEENENKIMELSDFLSFRAISIGYKIENDFRNVTGIKMKLKNIEYLESNGRHGLSNYSLMDKDVYHLYIHDKEKFNKLLCQAKKKYCGYFSRLQATNEAVEPVPDSNYSSPEKFKNTSLKNESFALSQIYSINTDFVNNEPIENFNFSTRTYNCLKRINADTLFDLLKLELTDLSNIKQMGTKSIDEIKKVFKRIINKQFSRNR